MPVPGTTDDPYADREGLLKSIVKEFQMVNDVGLLTTCPVGHIAWVAVLRMAYINRTRD